ncbi:mitochondrial 2-enoyl thioester reductase [Orbilia blumenaviensis]|uniref:enoyl-[acyl-carrier-protein] reductase n=1 Tax=Orbilia blumenaviensis TaxID=1796055 RepID=A0AAV9VAU8_9PEZI
MLQLISIRSLRRASRVSVQQTLKANRYYSTRFGYTLSRCLVFSNFGQPDKVLKLHSYSIPPPYDDIINVKFIASPINPADINQIEGVYPEKPEFTLGLGTGEKSAVPGNEGLVQVISCGSKVDPSIRPGQWAIMSGPNFGTWRTYAQARKSNLIMLPNIEGVSPIQAATASVNPSTAYRMLKDFAELGAGDYFVQNAANSGVGRSAIQIGKEWGFKSINIVRDRPGIDELKEELRAMGGTEVITEAEARDRRYIAQITGGQPVKLALNCVGGESATNLTRILGHGGHLVTYGAMAKLPLSIPASALIFKNIHCHGFWISAWSKKNEVARYEMITDIFDWVRDGKFKDIPYETIQWSEDTELEKLMDPIRKGISEYSGRKGIFVMEETGNPS